jgi:hypothetical protein
MPTWLIVVLAVIGFIGLVIGFVVLWFYQADAIRRMKAKITKKVTSPPSCSERAGPS